MTPKQTRFVQEYLIDLNATQAAIRAGYSEKTAGQIGEQNLKKLEVAQAVKAAMDVRAQKTEITAERVLEELWAIATADPNDIIQFRRGACRSCWSGTPEPEERLEPQGHGGALKRSAVVEPIAIADPNPDCEVCHGEGSGRAYAADTRFLPKAASKLYAGVKVTKDGFEIKMHDKTAALVNVGRHLGMFKDRTEHSGPDGGPMEMTITRRVVDKEG